MLVCFVPIVCILFGSCWLSIEFVKDLILELRHLNAEKFKRNDSDLKVHFYKIVQFYTDAKQLINEYNSIYQYTTLSVFLWSSSSICCSLVVIQMEMVKYTEAFYSLASK